ncbi:hypothetical protein LCGC14_2448460, partial [marine sediment metagenome]
MLEGAPLLSGVEVVTVNEPDPPALVEVVKGNLIITAGGSDDEIEIDQEGLADGQVRVSQGGEGTVLDGFTGDLIVRLGGGDDQLTLKGLDIAGKLVIEGGAGDDWLEIEDVTVGRGAKLDFGMGYADADIAGMVIGGDFRFRARATHYPGDGTYDDYWLKLYDSRIDGNAVLSAGRGYF